MILLVLPTKEPPAGIAERNSDAGKSSTNTGVPPVNRAKSFRGIQNTDEISTERAFTRKGKECKRKFQLFFFELPVHGFAFSSSSARRHSPGRRLARAPLLTTLNSSAPHRPNRMSLRAKLICRRIFARTVARRPCHTFVRMHASLSSGHASSLARTRANEPSGKYRAGSRAVYSDARRAWGTPVVWRSLEWDDDIGATSGRRERRWRRRRRRRR